MREEAQIIVKERTRHELELDIIKLFLKILLDKLIL